MKAVILAAGEGKRIDQAALKPKGLLLLPGHQTILSRLYRQLRLFFSPEEVIFVVGFQQEAIRAAFPTVRCVENPAYHVENTAKSLYRAIQEIEDDLVWVNGDVVCRDSVWSSFLQKVRTQVVVNCATTEEEEVKYTTSSGCIEQIGKHLFPAEGESVGIQMVCRENLPLFKEALASCQWEDYFEAAFQQLADQQVPIYPHWIEEGDAIEVDFPKDWQKACTLVRKWDGVL